MILSYLILVVSVALVTAYLSFRNNHRLANMLVMRSARETGLRIQDRITAFFEQPELINAYNAELIERKLINSRAQELLMQYFQKQIKARPTVNSIYFANPEGGLANSGIDKATNRPYVIFTEGFKSGRFLKYALDDSNNRAELLHQIPHFDARNRPWYIRATQSEGIVWSEIYPIATGNDLSITASRAVRDNAQQLIGVLGVDLFLSDISLFLQSLDLEPGAKTIVLDSEGYLVASSGGNKLYAENAETNTKTRIKATDSESSFIRAIAMELNGLDPDPSKPEDIIQLTSKIDDSAFFVSVLPFKAIPHTLRNVSLVCISYYTFNAVQEVAHVVVGVVEWSKGRRGHVFPKPGINYCSGFMPGEEISSSRTRGTSIAAPLLWAPALLPPICNSFLPIPNSSSPPETRWSIPGKITVFKAGTTPSARLGQSPYPAASSGWGWAPPSDSGREKSTKPSWNGWMWTKNAC